MSIRSTILGGLMMLAAACSGTSAPALESSELTGADETVAASEQAPSGCMTAAAQVETVAAVNLRAGPSADARILLVLPRSSQLAAGGESCPQNGYYPVRFGGYEGWAYGAHLRMTGMGTLESALSYANTRDDAIARARTGVGFSYWWGRGRWLETGATSTNKGSCTGSCPSCSHSGSYGADCSGYVAKVWVVPSTNQPVSYDWHPYSTYNFDNEYHGWHNVTRSSIQRADAMVYNTDGAGHIFLYEKGDPWGNIYAYECAGCSSGCRYGTRTAGSAYKAIGRDNITTSTTTPDTTPTFSGAWHLRNSNSAGSANLQFTYGTKGDLPVVGDWDGNGTVTVGVFRSNTWYLNNSNAGGTNSIPAFSYGTVGDIPLAGDWDGNGTDTIGVYRDGDWYLRNSNSAGTPSIAAFRYGLSEGDIPVVGDWNGDGIDTVGVYRDGTWYLRNSNSGGVADIQFTFGRPDDIPVVGDWNGDGIDTIGVARDGIWYLRNSNSGGAHDLTFGYGTTTDLPLVGDWDGNRTTTVGIGR